MANTIQIELTVRDGLVHCAVCESRIERLLRKLPGVLTVKADHRDQKVRLTLDPQRTNTQVVRERLSAIGYDTD